MGVLSDLSVLLEEMTEEYAKACDAAAEAENAAERAELTMAARSVAKVWLLRHEIEGVPLPSGFLAEHPEARVQVSARQALPTSTPTPTVPPPAPTPTSTVPINPITAAPTPTTVPTTLPFHATST